MLDFGLRLLFFVLAACVVLHLLLFVCIRVLVVCFAFWLLFLHSGFVCFSFAF